MSQDISDRIKSLSRNAIEELLEDYGFQVYDDETLAELQDAVFENIMDGTIQEDDLDFLGAL